MSQGLEGDASSPVDVVSVIPARPVHRSPGGQMGPPAVGLGPSVVIGQWSAVGQSPPGDPGRQRRVTARHTTDRVTDAAAISADNGRRRTTTAARRRPHTPTTGRHSVTRAVTPTQPVSDPRYTHFATVLTPVDVLRRPDPACSPGGSGVTRW